MSSVSIRTLLFSKAPPLSSAYSTILEDTKQNNGESEDAEREGEKIALINKDNNNKKNNKNKEIKRGGEGELWGSSFNLASAAIGLGILSLPYTVNNSGIVLGSILFLVMALVTVYSLDILVTCAEMCGRSSYQETVQEAFGLKVSTIVGGLIVWSSSGSTITSFTIVADLMSPIFHEGSALNNRILWMGLSFIVLFPLCYLRKINSLRHASGAAIIAFLYMASLVVISYFAMGRPKNDIVLVGKGITHIARSIPIIVYAYTCHTQAIPVYTELRVSTSRKMFGVILGGVGIAFGLYASTGIFGYLTFGSGIEDNILKNYQHERAEVLVGRILICSAIILGYPMSSWVMRNSFEQIYFYFDDRRKMDKMDFDVDQSEIEQIRVVSWRQNLIETIVILGVSMGIAILVPRINIVFGLVGSTSSVTLNFILPGLMYHTLVKRYPPRNKTTLQKKIQRIGAIALIVFGLIIGIVGTTTTIIGLAS